jgi:ankyrin repeat protein
MDSYLKLTSVKNNKNCNCISPFYINGITGINPNTGRDYSKEDLDAMKTALYRISAAKGCDVSVCCDPNDPTTSPNLEFTKQFMQKFPKIMPLYQGSQLQGIKLSTTANVKESGWQDPTPYMICKITKAKINDTIEPTVKMATNLVNDCYSDSCSSLETMTVNTLLQNAKADMTYTSFDDARVTQAILENNISYVKEYIRKYKGVNFPLTNDDYNNRLIHIAAKSSYNDILTMLIALKANLNVQNKLRETPIHLAVLAKNLDNISSLLSQGIDLTIPNNNGETAMFYAMKTGDLRIINMLYSNNSPIQGVDKNGNNLIHYCVLNCPSYKEDDNTVPNTKSEIIQFLIDHGISTEQKNISGIAPLEMVSKQINKQINQECELGNKKDNIKENIKEDIKEDIKEYKDDVMEKFFNISKPSPSGFKVTQESRITGGMKSTPKKSTVKPTGQRQLYNHSPSVTPPLKSIQKKEHFSSGSESNGSSTQQISQYTPEHISLLDIQTKLFNNIIQNNPNKYNDYISVDDIPKGAPIQVLDTVCVGGSGITGNEDTDECIGKGGSIVKIKNKTTKIKLELIPEEETQIDAVNPKDLYYPKVNDKIPQGTVPIGLANYNASVKSNGTVLPTTAQTKGITYDLGSSSSNIISSVENRLGVGSQPTETQPTETQSISSTGNITVPVAIPSITQNVIAEHPSILEEDNTIVHKCRRDAINNATKIATTTPLLQTSLQDFATTTTTAGVINNGSSASNFLQTYKIPIIILVVIIVLLLAYVIYLSRQSSS